MSMKIIIFLAIAMAVAAFVRAQILRQPIVFYSATMGDVETLFQQLKKTGENASYVTFAFESSEAMEGSHIELQFSIENDAIGFDWVLLGPEKARDLPKFKEIARSLGHYIQEKEGNGVKYLRVEDGDLVGLCTTVAKLMYKANDSTIVDVIAKNFEVRGYKLLQ